jgi:hypothetical protein
VLDAARLPITVYVHNAFDTYRKVLKLPKRKFGRKFQQNWLPGPVEHVPVVAYEVDVNIPPAVL